MTFNESTRRLHVLPASTLRGDTVKNRAGERLGTINELVIDLDEGRIGYCLLSVADELDAKLLPVPYGALTFDTARGSVILDVDKRRLKDAPAFSDDAWPDMTDRGWGRRVFGFYGLPPYWTASLPKEPIRFGFDFGDELYDRPI